MVAALPLMAAGHRSSQEQRAIRFGKRVSAKVLDPELPDKSFASWFRSLVGPDATVEWEVNDCGEQSGSPDDPQSIPMCAEATAHIAPQTTVVVSICVGTFEKGITDRPTLFWATVEHGGVIRDTTKLSELHELLRK